MCFLLPIAIPTPSLNKSLEHPICYQFLLDFCVLFVIFFIESDLSESIYAPIYGRLPLPMRNPNTFAPQARVAYVGDWE
jgi:hypothetical protein